MILYTGTTYTKHYKYLNYLICLTYRLKTEDKSVLKSVNGVKVMVFGPKFSSTIMCENVQGKTIHQLKRMAKKAIHKDIEEHT